MFPIFYDEHMACISLVHTSQENVRVSVMMACLDEIMREGDLPLPRSWLWMAKLDGQERLQQIWPSAQPAGAMTVAGRESPSKDVQGGSRWTPAGLSSPQVILPGLQEELSEKTIVLPQVSIRLYVQIHPISYHRGRSPVCPRPVTLCPQKLAMLKLAFFF